ncbi:MAG: nicotinate-nucleotide--dimethylbenzimidazole phosphoribosyltransferase, partial [Sulfurimonas sp.]
MPIRRIDDHTEVTGFPTEADFLLAASVTYTCTIEGITQTGHPGIIPLTPTLDAELITAGSVFSLPKMISVSHGTPTPALLTRAAQKLKPFSTLKILNLGLETPPKYCGVLDFHITPSPAITSSQYLKSRELFFKGMAAARVYTPKSGTLILGESIPSGTTTAYAALKALGYACEGLFSSSFKTSPDALKEQSIQAALQRIEPTMDNFEKLALSAD